MRKRILGAASIMLFALYLGVTSNIRENVSDTDRQVSEAVQNDKVVYNNENVVFNSAIIRAGACSTISGYSFTTESDERTSVEKRNVTLVTSANETSLENTADSEEVEETLENSPEETEESTEAGYANRWGISLTEEEIDLLARIVWLEANAEPVEGQEAVVEVIFNRMASDLFPDSLEDVLSQKNPVQFCSWKNRNSAQPTEKEYESIYNVLNGNTTLLRDDTIYFSRSKLTSNVDVQICCHYFCY